MEKGDVIRIEITDMTDDGRGIGHFSGMAVFVFGAVYGDTVDAVITKTKKRYAEAIVSDFIEYSPFRIVTEVPEAREIASSFCTEAREIASSFCTEAREIASSFGTEGREIASSFGTDAQQVCSYIDECGGCAYGKMTTEAEIKLKEKHVREKLTRIGGVANPVIKPIINSSAPTINSAAPIINSAAPIINFDAETINPACGEEYTGLNYRNKAVMAVDLGNDGTPLIGFRPRKSHDVVDCEYCMIQMPAAMTLAEKVRNYICEHPESFITDRGLIIKEITVKSAYSTNEVMVIFHTYEDVEIDSGWEGLIYYLDDSAEYSMESVYVWHKNPVCVAGKRTIEDELCGLRFEISPESFYQVNPVVAELLYEKALEYAGKGCILDLYCGVGTIGLIAASRGASKVIGVESVKAAVLDANRNAVINGITNATFICGKAEAVLPEIAGDETLARAFEWTVIVDPPRRGLDPRLIETLIEFAPERIVYVSCDPATLARDVKLLADGGCDGQSTKYALKECTPFNMFPRTGHIEVVSLLQRVSSAKSKS